MPIHVQTTSATVRFYKPGKCFDNHDPFEAVAFLQFMGDNTAFLSALHGRINKRIITELAGYLFGLGMRKLYVERHKRLISYDILSYLPRDFR